DFEEAVLPAGDPIYGAGMASVASALPGWRAYVSGREVAEIAFNSLSLGGAAVIVNGPNSLFETTRLQGKYSVTLFGSIIPFSDGSIGQIGTTPEGAKSVQFFTPVIGLDLPLVRVSFGDAILGLAKVEETATYQIWGADVSTFVGQTAELRFGGHILM